MSATLDELYLRWLYSQISPVSVKNPARTYWEFAKQLYQKEFIWFVPNDDNRAEDGKALRHEFFNDADIDEVDEEWMSLGCSMLEMLIALSRRLNFLESDRDCRDWFWVLIENIEIKDCSDKSYRKDPDLVHEIDEILESVIWRTYDYDGAGGGLFPLKHPPQDQKLTEIWYQMSFYIIESWEGG